MILAVNQEKMSSVGDVLKAVDDAVKAGRKSVLLQIERAGNQSFVAVPSATPDPSGTDSEQNRPLV